MIFTEGNITVSISDEYVKRYPKEKDFVVWALRQPQWEGIPEEPFLKAYRDITGKKPKEEKKEAE